MIDGAIFIALWAVIGCFITITLPTPKSFIESILLLVLGGPVIWGITIHVLVKKRKK